MTWGHTAEGLGTGRAGVSWRHLGTQGCYGGAVLERRLAMGVNCGGYGDKDRPQNAAPPPLLTVPQAGGRTERAESTGKQCRGQTTRRSHDMLT